MQNNKKDPLISSLNKKNSLINIPKVWISKVQVKLELIFLGPCLETQIPTCLHVRTLGIWVIRMTWQCGICKNYVIG